MALIVLGNCITALGPMFPYLSAAEGRLETEYSFLFLCRAIGYICGSIAVKKLEKYFNYHQCLCLGVGVPGLALLLFSMTGDLNLRGLFIFVASMGCALVDIFANVATISCF